MVHAQWQHAWPLKEILNLSNHVIVIENRSHSELNLSEQNFLETALGALPGSRQTSAPDFTAALQSEHAAQALLVFPLLIPKYENDCVLLLKSLERSQPFENLFALQFVLFADRPEFDPDSFSEEFWIETLDRFYDLAVPTQFLVCYQDAPSVVQFHVRASATSLFREMDNLLELKRIGVTLGELESRIDALETLRNAAPRG